MPQGPYPILAVNGEQGSGKSSVCRILRALFDPNVSPLRSPPRNDQDLVLMASNSRCVAIDNISHIQPWLSDALCRLSTGGGLSTRELYTNREETLFDVQRPVILNGIGDLATRSDLLDRMILITFPAIREADRREEKEITKEFRRISSGILGALLDVIAITLRNLAKVHLDQLPRMADFARLAVAAETALGFEPGSFLKAYSGNREEANQLVIETAAIGETILSFMHDKECYEDSASNLLKALSELTDEKTIKRQDWPKAPNSLSSYLRRIAPNLRQVGHEVSFPRSGGKKRIRIEKIKQSSSSMALASSASVQQVLPYESSSNQNLAFLPARVNLVPTGPVPMIDDPVPIADGEVENDKITDPSQVFVSKSVNEGCADCADDDDVLRDKHKDGREEMEI